MEAPPPPPPPQLPPCPCRAPQGCCVPPGGRGRNWALLEFDAAPKTVTLCRGGGLLLVPAEGGDAVEVPSFGGGLDFAGARVALAQGEVLLHRDGRLTVRNAVFVDARRP
jgi:hypothetical protein